MNDIWIHDIESWLNLKYSILQFLAKNLISWGIDFTFEFNWIHGNKNATEFDF